MRDNFVYRDKSLMIIISSPSGAGKTTLCKKLLEHDQNVKSSVSVTTRPKRILEQDGIDYYFISEKEFQDLVNKNELLEHAKVFDYYYGTKKKIVDQMLEQGNDVLFDVDWQGTLELYKHARDKIVSIFILPPSLEELEKRLKARAQDSEEVIQRRMKKSRSEISHYKEYDYVIVNQDVEKSFDMLLKIIEVERAKRSRLKSIDKFVTSLINGS